MRRDPKAFRERFAAWKNGELVYDAGRIVSYAEGKDALPGFTGGYDEDALIDYLGTLENPTKHGLKNGIWRPPTDSTKWDVNLIGMGLDIRQEHNPIVYNFLKSKGRLNNPYLTESEERELRKQTWQQKKPILERFIKDKDLSERGILTAAGMLWQGHPYKMMNTPDSVTGKALIKALETGDRDLSTVFDAYYKYPANAKRYASRINSNANWWNSHPYGEPVEDPVSPTFSRPAPPLDFTAPRVSTDVNLPFRRVAADNQVNNTAGWKALNHFETLDILKDLDKGYGWKLPKLPPLFPLNVNQWTNSLIGYKGGKDGEELPEGFLFDTQMPELTVYGDVERARRQNNWLINRGQFPRFYSLGNGKGVKEISMPTEKGLETVSPEFYTLAGLRPGGDIIAPITKNQIKNIGRAAIKQAAKHTSITPKNAASITPEQWTAAQDAAIARGDMAEAQRLRDLHFMVNSPNNKAISSNGVPLRSYHTVYDKYDPSFTKFNPEIKGRHSSIYTTDNPFMSGSYTTKLTSEAERDNIIEVTRQRELDSYNELLKNAQNTKVTNAYEKIKKEEAIQLANKQIKIYSDPKKARKQILNDHQWVGMPIESERMKSLYVNLENPVILDNSGHGWNNIPLHQLPQDVYDLIKPDIHGNILNASYTTRSLEEAQRAVGRYDGAIVKNVIDYGGQKNYGFEKPGTVFQVNNSNNIKLADAVTYDNNGIRIPLGERDNFNINDIRWGLLPFAGITGAAAASLKGYANGKDRLPGYATGEDGGFLNWLKNAVIGASVADAPAVATASGWHNEDGQWRLNRTAADELLGLNLSVLSTFSPTHPLTAATEKALLVAGRTLKMLRGPFVADVMDIETPIAPNVGQLIKDLSKDYTLAGGNERFNQILYDNYLHGYDVPGLLRTLPKVTSVPDEFVKIYKNSITPRLALQRPWMNAEDIQYGVDNALKEGYRVYDDAIFKRAGRPDAEAGFYNKTTGRISIKNGYEDFAIGHEVRHRVDDMRVPLVESEENLLNASFTDDFKNQGLNMSEEMVTTNFDGRKKLLGKDVLKRVPISKQNEMIDEATYEEMVLSMEGANRYGKRYVEALINKYGRVPDALIKAWKESYKHVGMLTGAAAVSKTKKKQLK